MLHDRTLPDLVLPLKREYFEQIKHGEKLEEFRLCTPYWAKRLEGREYGRVVLTLGYPSRNDTERRMVRPWRGFTKRRITHPTLEMCRSMFLPSMSEEVCDGRTHEETV